MMRNITIFGLMLLIAYPSVVRADVLINEIAWMGGVDNANAEWIELLNSGSESVDLTGWHLVSSSGTPSITLSGSIAAQGFFLLTRTSLSLIPGVTGDQVYTGALSNAGTTLTLSDTTSAVVDAVVGGTNWADIGGDNTTKKTPQRGESGWVTATPTPKAPNAAIAGDTTDDEDNTAEETEQPATTTPVVTIGGSSTTTVTPSYTLPKLYLVAGPNRVVTTYATTPFVAYVYDERGKLTKNAQVSWAFGDGAFETESVAEHAYAAPGTYLVVVRAENAYTSTIRTLTVEVVSADVSIGTVSDEGVTLVNNSNQIVDLSGWQIKAGTKRFKIPKDTALLPQSQVLLPVNVTKLDTTSAKVELLFSNGLLASEARPTTLELLSERSVMP